MFNHKSTAAWDALTVALINAKFAITRTWPVKTEAESSIHIKGKRRRPHNHPAGLPPPRGKTHSTKPWHEVEELIAQAVQGRHPGQPEAKQHLQAPLTST